MTQESVLRITIDSRNAERNARALANELGSIEKKGDFASKSMDSMSVATRQLAGYMAGLVTVGAAINKMDAYTNLQNRLKLVTNSQQELNQAMNDTFKIAQSSYQTWDSVVQVYQRFSDNAKTLGINMEQTAKLTETVSKAVAVSGASTQAAEAALTQFGQALASGTLRGEELNSILEQTPALAKAIAQGMEITVGQLRSVAAEGKITGDVLVDALTKSADSVEQLFQKTDITISQSIGLLSNELTKFIGEAGQSSGAANLLAESVKLLAQNLSLLADAAVVGGIGYITKAILTKTVAVQGAIAASVAQKAADAAEAQSSLAVATAKVNEAKAHLANVQATNAETQAKYGAAAANARYKLASDAVTQALIAQNAAQGALNSSVTLGSRALALVGGPIGAITLGVSALAAGYMYLQNRTAEANAKLEEQGQIASKTSEELEKLAGNDKVSAINDLTAAFNSQNEALSKSKEAVDAVLFAIRASSVENERARKITEDARNGVISYTDAIKLLNNEKISVDLYNKLKQQADQYDENSIKAGNTQRALAALKVEVSLAGNAMQDAANKALNKAAAMDQDASATRDAAQANREYTQSLQQKLFDQAFITRLVTKHNKTQQEANLLLEAHKKTNGQISAQDKELIAGITAQQKALENYGKVQSTTSKARSSAAKSENAAAKESSRIAQEQYQLREQIAYEYTDRIGKIEKDLAREIAEIQKANFANPEHTAGYIEAAQGRAMLEKELYIAQLRQQYSEWRATEEEKLDFKVHINELMIQLDSNMTEEMRSDAMRSLKDQANYELAQIKLAKETRIFQAEQAMMSEMQIIQKRYALEYAEISRINDLEERGRRMNAATYSKKMDEDNLQWNTTLNYNNAIGVDTSAVQALKARQDAIDAMYQEGFIKQKEYEAASLASRQQYDRDLQSSALSSLNTMLSATSSTWSNMTQLVKDGAGEQSGAYKAMFLVQQAFAMTTATINALMAYNQVLANPWTFDPISKQVAASITLGMGMANVGMIAAQTIAGFANGGYTGHGGKYEPAGVVHKGEGVLTQEEVKALGGPQGFEDLRKSIRRGYATGGLVADTHRVGMGAVSAINSGGGNSSSSGGDVYYTQTIHIASDGSTTSESDAKQLGKMMENMTLAVIRREQRQGGLLSK